MNDIQQIRQNWPAPVIRSESRREARQQLMAVMADRPSRSPGFRSGRGRRTAVIGFAAVAAVAAGVVLSGELSTGGPGAATPAAALSVNGILSHASVAANVTAAPPTSGYAYSKYLQTVPGSSHRTTIEEWDSLSGKGDDEQVIDGRREIAPASRFAGAYSTYDQLLKLPTDPAGLLATIQRSPIPRGADPAQRVLTTLRGIAARPNVPPRLRIAVFGLLARQASVSVVRDAIDPAGRRGIGIAMRFGGGYAETDVFDAHTYAFLGSTDRVPAAVDSGHVVSPAGTVGQALMDSGFVHALNERP